MKILHIVPSIRTGGVVSVLYNLVRYQTSMGDDVVIYVTRSDKRFRRLEPEFSEIGVDMYFSKYSKAYDPRHIGECRRLMKNADIVHVHLFPNQLWANIAYRTLTGKSRAALLTTEHNTFNNRRKYPLFRYFDRFLYAPYDSIVSISAPTKIAMDNWLGSVRISEKNI
ncbi:MAG: glycosyltransferase, partial [Allobaculum sp.]|nr:glycosyltransferase [Allobaculum sp.]